MTGPVDNKDDENSHSLISILAGGLFLFVVGVFVFYFPQDLGPMDNQEKFTARLESFSSSMKTKGFSLELSGESFRFKGDASRDSLGAMPGIGTMLVVYAQPYYGFLGVLFPNDRYVAQMSLVEGGIILPYDEVKGFVESRRLGARVAGVFFMISSLFITVYYGMKFRSR